jgi:hypothetical protein
MAQTTFKGPVTSLNGFIGGPNVNAGGTSATDTQQGGNTPFTVTNVTTLSNGTDTLSATTNEGVMVYVQDGANSAACYAFSDGATWLRMDNLANVSAT